MESWLVWSSLCRLGLNSRDFPAFASEVLELKGCHHVSTLPVFNQIILLLSSKTSLCIWVSSPFFNSKIFLSTLGFDISIFKIHFKIFWFIYFFNSLSQSRLLLCKISYLSEFIFLTSCFKSLIPFYLNIFFIINTLKTEHFHVPFSLDVSHTFMYSHLLPIILVHGQSTVEHSGSPW